MRSQRHSLPQRVLASGDPLRRAVPRDGPTGAERGSADERWSWAYQSAGRTPEPWAGPDLGDHLAALAAADPRRGLDPGRLHSDHVEILFDIDQRAAAVGAGPGMRLEQPPALNDEPVFIATLAELVRERAQPWLAGVQAVKVAVAGGIAAYAAARRLEAVAPDAEIVLIESDVVLGGKLRTEHVDGFVIEAAPDSFLSRKERGVGLVQELGLAEELIAAARASPHVRFAAAATCTRSPRASQDDPHESRRPRAERSSVTRGQGALASEPDVPTG